MAGITQANRKIGVKTPLADDALLLASFRGTEGISELFHFDLEMLSEQDDLDASKLVGKDIGFHVKDSAGQKRFFHGILKRFAAGPRRGVLRSYRAEIVPWLWVLSLRVDCRIFQNQKATDIIEAVFKAANVPSDHYKIDAAKDYNKREYCVQYRESDFNFVSRLMEEEGMFYFFKHTENGHQMVIGDDKTHYFDCAEKEVEYRQGHHTEAYLNAWEHRYDLRSGKWKHTDYEFKTATLDLATDSATVQALGGNDKLEVYDHPGDYQTKDYGSRLSKRRVEAEEAAQNVIEAAGGCASFTPGGKFKVTRHDCANEEGTYVITSIEHEAEDNTYQTGFGGTEQWKYVNKFTCIPSARVFRPQRVTRRPVIGGPQTAVVTGPSGSEIHTDEYGRIKVKFFWDRNEKTDDTTSCWIRVVQRWADASWGAVVNPRVGQEVVVEFLEGDPDRPLVTGCVYNSAKKPPYTLPDKQTQTVFKTRSTPQGSSDNYNEIVFEDKKDNELISIHAEKDFERTVENNDKLRVGFDKKNKGDQTIEIYNDRTTSLEKGNDKLTIKSGDLIIEVQKGNETHTIDKGSCKITAKMSIELVCGKSSIKIEPAQITLQSPEIAITGDMMAKVSSKVAMIDGSMSTKISGMTVAIN